MTITRSTGTPVVVASIPYLVGSGYQGKTEELDNTVKLEAELLAKTFNRDIEIRFNSDRESGGAWLVNSLKGFDGNCQIGLGAGLKPRIPEGMSREDFYIKSSHEFICSQPKELYIDTYIKQSALKDANLANEGNPESRYCWLEHKSVEDALAWLTDNVDRNKILD